MSLNRLASLLDKSQLLLYQKAGRGDLVHAPFCSDALSLPFELQSESESQILMFWMFYI